MCGISTSFNLKNTNLPVALQKKTRKRMRAGVLLSNLPWPSYSHTAFAALLDFPCRMAARENQRACWPRVPLWLAGLAQLWLCSLTREPTMGPRKQMHPAGNSKPSQGEPCQMERQTPKLWHLCLGVFQLKVFFFFLKILQILCISEWTAEWVRQQQLHTGICSSSLMDLQPSAPTAAFRLANPRNPRRVNKNRFSLKSQGQGQCLLICEQEGLSLVGYLIVRLWGLVGLLLFLTGVNKHIKDASLF